MLFKIYHWNRVRVTANVEVFFNDRKICPVRPFGRLNTDQYIGWLCVCVCVRVRVRVCVCVLKVIDEDHVALKYDGMNIIYDKIEDVV